MTVGPLKLSKPNTDKREAENWQKFGKQSILASLRRMGKIMYNIHCGSDKTSSLVQGNASFRTTGQDQHKFEATREKHAAKRYNEVESAQTGTPTQKAMDAAIWKMNTANWTILIQLFNRVYYILKSEDLLKWLPGLALSPDKHTNPCSTTN